AVDHPRDPGDPGPRETVQQVRHRDADDVEVDRPEEHRGTQERQYDPARHRHGRYPAPNCWRRSTFLTLPVMVRGRVSTYSTWLGRNPSLNPISARWARSESSVGGSPLGTTTAQVVSSASAGMPITATSAT